MKKLLDLFDKVKCFLRRNRIGFRAGLVLAIFISFILFLLYRFLGISESVCFIASIALIITAIFILFLFVQEGITGDNALELISVIITLLFFIFFLPSVETKVLLQVIYFIVCLALLVLFAISLHNTLPLLRSVRLSYAILSVVWIIFTFTCIYLLAYKAYPECFVNISVDADGFWLVVDFLIYSVDTFFLITSGITANSIFTRVVSTVEGLIFILYLSQILPNLINLKNAESTQDSKIAESSTQKSDKE